MMIKIALLVLVAVTLVDIVRGIIKKKGKYTFKKNINNLRFIVALVVAMFLVIGVVELSMPIAEWAKQKVIEYGSGTDTAFVLSLAPFVWIGVGMWAAFWLIFNSFKPIWKYTDEEKEWEEEGKQKTRRLLKKVLPFLPIKEV